MKTFLKEEWHYILGVVLTFLLLIFVFGHLNNLYKRIDNVFIADKLSSYGYTNIQVEQVQREFGGFGRCTRDDFASFDFVAMSSEGKKIDDMYGCAGTTMWKPNEVQITIRQR